ncbi:hypothetical protein Pla22_30490 [Rubripirellula amarantea]|uniref:Uncharacterized protein n=1 Tax=Rubripirellula amarantea TaxID=2527999 RepID=A0A5C5WHP0_9BACT|nr:BBP7 family outer membrane beta-barrel protein [Rubripirellula amarantea]TWT50308.1 hypothetical protein Pla22_30490 [Rubripirellula amarantea]
MNKKFLRRAALALSLSAGAFGLSQTAEAGQPYSSPSQWNNFRPALDEALAAEDAASTTAKAKSSIEELPAPKPTPAPMAAPSNKAHLNQGYPTDAYSGAHESTAYPSATHSSGNYSPVPHNSYAPQGTYSTMPSPNVGSGCAPCESSMSSPSPYAHAMSSSWEGSSSCGSGDVGSCGVDTNVRNELFPYFGSANILFMSLSEGRGRNIATGLGNDFNTSIVDPGSSVGFDVSAGRYLGNGCYGLGITYFNWDPGSESVTRLGTPGSIRATMPQYRDASIDVGGAGIDTVYNYIDGTIGAGAGGVRATRDLSFQGIEANLFSFGLMGARRASYATPCGSNGYGMGRGLGWGAGHGSCGYGGAAGPLVRASSGRVRVTTSHGFRWFQIKDSSELAYNIDGTAGYQAEDIYDNVDTENNLFGYQFGGRLTYCLGNRLDFNIGGKFGVYGNRAELRHRLGTQTTLAYPTGAGTDLVDTVDTDTVLSTLGELDLGLGYRISNAWTVRGGYRVMGITGVANAMDSYSNYYTSAAAAGTVFADDSYVLHGAYVGAEFNW